MKHPFVKSKRRLIKVDIETEKGPKQIEMTEFQALRYFEIIKSQEEIVENKQKEKEK